MATTIKEKGYLYIRTHPAYDTFNACKLGKASNIPDRDSQYATGEIKRGVFELVLEISIEKMGITERLIQNEFKKLNIRFDAGTEFYDKIIITQIKPYLSSLQIPYRILSKEEINELVRCNRVKESSQNQSIQMIIKNKIIQNATAKSMIETTTESPITTSLQIYSPRTDQSAIIENAISYFQNNEKGVLIIPCGVGKTLISLWITQRLLAGNSLRTIIIGVPNKLLLKQWESNVLVIFTNTPYIIVSGTIDTNTIMKFLQNNFNECIVITTYSSAHKVFAASQKIEFKFNMKINDECHHLTTRNMQLSHTTKTYIQMLHISSIKQLSLTATLKYIESDNDGEENNTVSNDNIEHFGEIIDKKCLLWAIKEDIICDYEIQTIITDEDVVAEQLMQFSITNENDARLFLSAFASMKSIFCGDSKHLLIYCNNKENTIKIVKYIEMILVNNKYFEFSNTEFYYSNYHSEMKSREQKEIIDMFDKSRFGIITCVYCLGEGWDFPLLDAVVFAENMTSNIRIVQSALRASRKNKREPNKKTKIILPVLETDDWIENRNNIDLKKVTEIIHQMGEEDETITQKIKVFRTDFSKQERRTREPGGANETYVIGEYDCEITNKLRLKTTKRTALGITYEKCRKIIADKKMCWDNFPACYYDLCEKDVRLSKEPDIVFKQQFTNWIEYLSIEHKYYDIEICKIKVQEYLDEHPEMRVCGKLEQSIVCKNMREIDENFPPVGLWDAYYNIKDIGDIITVKPKKRKPGFVI